MKKVWIATALFGAQLGGELWALDLNPAELRGSGARNPVAVLQNRYFTKELRPEIGLATGSFLNEAYTKTSMKGARVSLFLNEWIGVEAQSFTTSIADSVDRKALNELKYRKLDDPEAVVSPDPEINQVYSIRDVNAVFAPFYGKLNLMDQMILYSDLYLTGGMAQIETFQGTKTAASIGAGERFYFLQSLSLRIDFRDRIFKETRGNEATTRHAYSVDFGLSYFFL